MVVVNHETDTTADEIADGIFRISTPLPPGPEMPTGFTFNQYLIRDDLPLLYHTGPRAIFARTAAAIARVLPVERLRYIAFSHIEADECGALNRFLDVAAEAEPLCGEIAAMTSVRDMADRPPRALGDGESLRLGRHSITWIATPHLPHGWECGHLFETTTRTLFCGDLFTQLGDEHPALTEADILESSEAARIAFDYYSHSRNGPALLERLAGFNPETLACMHGAAWRGDGAAMLRKLGQRLGAG